jgi:hypothetical protein
MPRLALLRSVAFTFGILAVGCNVADRPSGAEGAAGAAPSVAALTSTDTLNLVAKQDTSVRLGTPNQNYGTEASLDVNRALVQFDQSALQAIRGAKDAERAERQREALAEHPVEACVMCSKLDGYPRTPRMRRKLSVARSSRQYGHRVLPPRRRSRRTRFSRRRDDSCQENRLGQRSGSLAPSENRWNHPLRPEFRT